MRALRHLGGALALMVATAGVAGGQAGADNRGAAVGGQWREYRLGSGAGASRVRQWVIPVGATFGTGRFTLDAGTSYAVSSLGQVGATDREVSGLTDTQVRATYVFGRDLLVASMMVNLPTGRSKASAEDFPVLGAISSAFLPFPVGSYGSGFSATSGLAVAVPAGLWSMGLAGSLRWTGEFTPYIDANGPFTYQPGIEGRIRAGVDRIVGRSRVTAGLTYSTFGTDQFASGATTTGVYRPGNRWIAEVGGVAPVGRSATLSVFGWHYLRVNGDSSLVAVMNQERISSAGGRLEVPLSSGVDLNLGLDGRTAKMGTAPGRAVGAEVGFGLSLGRHASLLPSVRYDVGTIDDGPGQRNLRGLSFAVFLRSR